MPALTLTESDDGRSFNVHVGDQLFVRLEESPTTGYQWAVEQSGDVLVLESSDFFPAGTGVGTGGERVFTFAVQRSGSARVSLNLRRDWEADTSAIKRFEVELKC